MMYRTDRRCLRNRLLGLTVLSSISMVLLTDVPAQALNLYNGTNAGNDLEINLTTTLSYTGTERVNNPSKILLSSEDGDANFQHGITANLFSAVPVLDIRDGDYGAHFSGQLYINTPYLGTNQNDLTPYSSSIYSAKQTDFPSGTRNVDGENAQVLDAFVFGQHTFADDQTLQLKVGRSVLFWGQSLFFPTDGISGGMAPINVISAQNLINPQSQQVFMPVGQGILTYQPVSGTTIQGYYQFEWQHDYFQGEGAYFNSNNVLDKGASYQSIANLGSATIGLSRVHDLNPPHQNGQFGMSVQQEAGNYDLGLYALRFDAKGPEIGIDPSHPTMPTPIPGAVASALSGGTYVVAYPLDTWIEGVSFSTNIGTANVAGELSSRQNQPLVPSVSALYISQPGQNTNSNPGYPVGNTWDAQLSALDVTPGIPLDPGGVTLEGEIILNHLINVTHGRNPAAPGLSGLRVGGQATAGAFTFVVVPTYDDVLPNAVVTVPIGVTYDYLGRSNVDSALYHGNGDFNIGVTGTYKSNLTASLTYQDFFGKANIPYNALADRGYVSLNLQYTF